MASFEQKHTRQHCNIDIVNHEAALHHFKSAPGVNICILYTRGASMPFQFNVEDENLSSISFLCDGTTNVWYVVDPTSQVPFERIVLSQIMDKKYLDDRYGGSPKL